MSINVYAVNAGSIGPGERVFDSAYTLMFASPIRISHQYFSGGNLHIALDVASIELVTFEVTDVIQGPGGQVWVRPATMEEVSARLFIQEGGDVGDVLDEPVDCSNGCPDHDPRMFPTEPVLPLPSYTDPQKTTPVNLGNVPHVLDDHEDRLRRIEANRTQRTHHFKHHPGDVGHCKTCDFERRPVIQPEPPDVIDTGAPSTPTPHTIYAQAESEAAT